MKLSIVTTLYRSQRFVEEFHRRASAAARLITDDYEIVMVDDGSPDDSLRVAVALAERDPHLRVVELSRNFGHHKALMTAMEHATGDLIFLIDSDLEEAPESLVDFHRTMVDGDWDVVYAYQERRKGRWIERQLGSLAWGLAAWIYATRIPRNHCTMRLMRRDYVESLLRHRERNIVIGGLFAITGYRQVGLPIVKGSREGSSYTFLARAGLFIEGVTAFSTIPLTLMSYLGLIVAVSALVFGLVVVARKLLFGAEAGWASVMASVWFVGGAVIFCMGVIGLYVAKVFIETKDRPYTIVRRVYGGQESPVGRPLTPSTR
jgi:putative glycosyltransferase